MSLITTKLLRTVTADVAYKRQNDMSILTRMQLFVRRSNIDQTLDMASIDVSKHGFKELGYPYGH